MNHEADEARMEACISKNNHYNTIWIDQNVQNAAMKSKKVFSFLQHLTGSYWWSVNGEGLWDGASGPYKGFT